MKGKRDEADAQERVPSGKVQGACRDFGETAFRPSAGMWAFKGQN